MRGNPQLRIILVALAVILMGWPVWRLTHASPPEMLVHQATTADAREVEITLTFAHPPESFSISNGDVPVLSGKGPASNFQAAWTVRLPKEGVDLLVKAQWPAGTPRTAVEISATTATETLADRTFWGDRQLTEILTVLPTKP